jgi:hypothetical protein
MAALKIKMSRKSLNVPWFIPDEKDKFYVRDNYPSIELNFKFNGSFLLRREFTGDHDILQQIYDEYHRVGSVLNKRMAYCKTNDITFDIVIED